MIYLSLKHASFCAKATAIIKKKADAITKKALMKLPTSSLKLGDIILVPLDDVDCTKVDGKNIVGVIVLINKNKSTCKVAVKQGLLHCANVYHSLRLVPKALNICEVMDLEDAFKDWKGLPKITEREAACFVSSVGGQGMIKCQVQLQG